MDDVTFGIVEGQCVFLSILGQDVVKFCLIYLYFISAQIDTLQFRIKCLNILSLTRSFYFTFQRRENLEYSYIPIEHGKNSRYPEVFHLCSFSSNQFFSFIAWTYVFFLSHISISILNLSQAIPKAPVIENLETVGNRSLLRGVESTPLNLTCTSVGGYPVPDMSLRIGNTTMLTKIHYNMQDDGTFIAILWLQLFPERRDDRSRVSCELRHPAITGSLDTFSMLYLSCKFVLF